MVIFLTSSPTGDLDGRYRVEGIDDRNGFKDELKKVWKENSRCLIISAAPAEHERNEEFQSFLGHALHVSGFSVACVDLLDDRWMHITRDQLLSYDAIWLGGGHVPTQNAFLKAIGVREMLKDYDGLVIGISAGTMNCADVVYAQPEDPGEAIDPSYQRFISGLGLTDINVLPHYQMLYGSYIDGLRLFEDVTFPDSYGKTFIALPDGSYIKIEGDHARIYGEAYRIYPDHMEDVSYRQR